jgi:hypothetical protein
MYIFNILYFYGHINLMVTLGYFGILLLYNRTVFSELNLNNLFIFEISRNPKNFLHKIFTSVEGNFLSAYSRHIIKISANISENFNRYKKIQ